MLHRQINGNISFWYAKGQSTADQSNKRFIYWRCDRAFTPAKTFDVRLSAIRRFIYLRLNLTYTFPLFLTYFTKVRYVVLEIITDFRIYNCSFIGLRVFIVLVFFKLMKTFYSLWSPPWILNQNYVGYRIENISTIWVI